MQIEIATKYIPRGKYELRAAGRYQDGSPALVIFGEEGRILTATVCLDTVPKVGHVMIKDWSENEGVLAALNEAGVIGKPVNCIQTGFVTAYECPLSKDAQNELNI